MNELGLAERKKGSKFHLNSKNIYLTFPRNETPKELVAERLAKWAADRNTKITGLIIAQEHHEDGGLHLHSLLVLDRPFQTTKADCFDFAAGKHGNYQGAREPWRIVRYCRKSDPAPHAFGVLPEEMNSRVKPTEAVVKRIKEGASLNEIRDEFPAMYLRSKRQIVEFHADEQLKKAKHDLKPWMSVEYRGEDPVTAEVVKWMNENIGKPRIHKQKQLWVWGPTDVGKTSLGNFIKRFWTVWDAAYDGKFFDGFDDNYDVVVMDEFKGQYTIQQLNQFVEGTTCILPIKGGFLRKTRNVPVIVLSNYPPHLCYSKVLAERVETILSRFKVIEVETKLDVIGDNLLALTEVTVSPAGMSSSSPTTEVTQTTSTSGMSESSRKSSQPMGSGMTPLKIKKIDIPIGVDPNGSPIWATDDESDGDNPDYHYSLYCNQDTPDTEDEISL